MNIDKDTLNEIQAAAFTYLQNGFQPVPIPFMQKGPIRPGWQNERITHQNITKIFNEKQMNIGVKLGPDSNGLIDIDLDSKEAVECAAYLMPSTAAIFGRASNRASHRLYICEEIPNLIGKGSHQIHDANSKLTTRSSSNQAPNHKPLLLEIRCGGGGKAAQTVFPPSVHPSGEPIEWEPGANGKPAIVKSHELLMAANQVSAAALIARYMTPQGGRHDLYLRIGGVLARAGLSLDRIKLIAEASAIAGGANPKDAVRTVADAFKAYEAGTLVYGLTALREIFGQELANQIADLVGYGEAKSKDHFLDLSEKSNTNPDLKDGVQLIRADCIKPEPIIWVWPHYFAECKLHIIAGAPGTGKTTLSLSLASIVSRGGLWPDGASCSQNNVIIWSGEDGVADTLVPRLLAANADMTRIFFVEAVRENGKTRQFDPAKDMSSLESKIKEAGGAGLVIIDPIVSAVSGDSHKNVETRRGLQPLVDLAASAKVAILGITHLSKGSKGVSPIERVTGSLAFGAVARAVYLTIAENKGTDSIDAALSQITADSARSSVSAFVRAKSNIGPVGDGFEYQIENQFLEGHSNIETSRLKWGKAIRGDAQALIAKYENENNSDRDSNIGAVQQASQFLRDYLAKEASWCIEVQKAAKEIGISEAALNRAKSNIGIISKKQSDSKWFWQLPDNDNTE